MIKIHGHPLSPFVRKALLALELKGVDYELEVVMPGTPDPAFRAISPLGKIPVLEHDGFTVPDTSIICRYLERIFPEPALYPTDPKMEATATWIEEFADTRLMEACGGLFQQRFLHPNLLGTATDEAVVENILKNVMPPVLDYLESIVPEQGTLLGGPITIADISVVTAFVQGQYGEFEVTGAHPRLRAYLDRGFANDTLKSRLESERKLLASG